MILFFSEESRFLVSQSLSVSSLVLFSGPNLYRTRFPPLLQYAFYLPFSTENAYGRSCALTIHMRVNEYRSPSVLFDKNMEYICSGIVPSASDIR